VLIDSPRYLSKHSGVTVRESPDEHAPEDDAALLATALDHSWAWYDGRRKRSFEVINYYLVATAILITAYTSAINGKHYGFATVIALAGLVLTAIASTTAVHEARASFLAVPPLAELQERLAGRLSIDSISMFERSKAQRLVPGGYVVVIALVSATLLNIGAVVYALVRL
jgi:hypothetical protein